MSTVNDERIFSVPPKDCPSELLLDRFVQEELRSDEARVVHDHVDGCSRCQTAVGHRRAGFDALPALDVARTVDRIHHAVEPSWLDKIIAALRRPIVFVPLAAAPVVALLVLAAPTDRIRAKGTVALRVFRERNKQVEEVSSGSTFAAGDRLAFKVRVPDPEHVMIFSVEASARVTAVYPSVGAKRSGPLALKSDGALDVAVRLDDYDRDEWLHLVWCPEAFQATTVDLASPSTPKIREGCIGDTFHLRRR